MTAEYLLACERDSVGSNLAFHAIDGRGYTTNIEQAHTYTEGEMYLRAAALREFEFFVDKDRVFENAVWKVDSQYIKHEDPQKTVGPWLAYKKRAWDGNDVYFLSAKGETSSCLLNAVEFAKPVEDLSQTFGFISKALVDQIKRKTFAEKLVPHVKIDFINKEVQ